MKLTDKRFWIAWAIAELLLLASCIDVAARCQSFGMICVFAVSQPLMIVLALLKKTHLNAASVNLVIISLYTVYSIIIRLTHDDIDGWGWFALTVIFPIVQLLLLLIYWGLTKLAEITQSND